MLEMVEEKSQYPANMRGEVLAKISLRLIVVIKRKYDINHKKMFTLNANQLFFKRIYK